MSINLIDIIDIVTNKKYVINTLYQTNSLFNNFYHEKYDKCYAIRYMSVLTTTQKLCQLGNKNLFNDFPFFLKNIGHDMNIYLPHYIMYKVAATLFSFTYFLPIKNKYSKKENKNCIFPEAYEKMFFWKDEEFPSDFIFEISLNLAINIQQSSNNNSLISNELMSLGLILSEKFSNEFYDYEIVKRIHNFKIFKKMRFFKNKSDFKQYADFDDFPISMSVIVPLEIIIWLDNFNFLEDINKILPTMPELLDSNLNEQNYFIIFISNESTFDFFYQVILDIFQNSFKQKKHITIDILNFLAKVLTYIK